MEKLVCIASARTLASKKESQNGEWKEIDDGSLIKIKIFELSGIKNTYFVHGNSIYNDMQLFEFKIDQHFKIDHSAPRLIRWKTKNCTYGFMFETKQDQNKIQKMITKIIQQINADGQICLENIKQAPKIVVTEAPRKGKFSTMKSINSPSIASSSSLFEMRQHLSKETDFHHTLDPDIFPGRLCKRCNMSSSLPCLESLKDNLPCPIISPTKRVRRYQARVESNRKQCTICGKSYLESENIRGSCSREVDCFKNCLETVSCIFCGRGLMYHCFSGSERDEEPEPCTCQGTKVPYRWFSLAILSLFVPCLCLYLPLKGCHAAGKWCGVCGARHTDKE